MKLQISHIKENNISKVFVIINSKIDSKNPSLHLILYQDHLMVECSSFMVLMSCFIFFKNHAAMVSTLVPTESPYFQSGVVGLTQTSITSVQYVYAIKYKIAKTLLPDILLSYKSVDYNLNHKYTVNGSFLLFIQLNASSPTLTGFTALAQTATTYQLSLIKYSYLAIDTSFPYYTSFNYFFLNYPDKDYYFNFNYPASSSPLFAIFQWRLNYEVNPSNSTSSELFGLQWEITNINTTLTRFFSRSNMTNYYKLATSVIIMAVYSDTIPSNQYKVETFAVNTANNLSSIFQSLIFSDGKSNIMIGLSQFYLTAYPNTTIPSFSFSTSHQVNGLFRLHNLNAFSSVVVHVFVITRLQCPPDYPFKKKNATTNAFQCFDACASNQFEDYNATTYVYFCTPCTFPCQTCSSATICNTCVYYMDLNSTFGCMFNNTYANISNTISLCSQLINNCLTCLSDGSQCTSCDSQYALNLNKRTCLPCTGIDSQCKQCTNAYCLVCNSGYILFDATACIIYTPSIPPPAPVICDSNCSICNTLNSKICLVCVDSEDTLQNGICQTKCGDGKIMGLQQCDDNNIQNFDGCSSECKLQQGFQCSSRLFNTSSSKYNISQCIYNKLITLQVRRMVKQPYENKFTIYILTPLIYASVWRTVNLSDIITLSGSAAQSITQTIINFDNSFLPHLSSARLLQTQAYDPNSYCNIIVQLSYNSTLQNKDLTITINPQNTYLSTFSSINSFQSKINLSADNNILAHYYQDSYYKIASGLQIFTIGLGVACLGMILVGIFVGNMMISLQVSFLCQLCYFSLIDIGELNPLFYALSGLRYSSGYNIPLLIKKPIYEQNNSKNIIGTGMHSSMIDNVNLSLILIILSLLIGSVLKMLTKFVIKKQQMKQRLLLIGNNCIGSVSFYLCNCFTLLFIISIAINFITKASSILNYPVIVICVLLIVGLSAFYIKWSQSEYFNKLMQKMRQFKVAYVMSMLGVKVVIGLLIGVLGQNIVSCILVCVIYTIWSLVVLLRLKPHSMANNIRLTISLILGFIIQLIIVYQSISTTITAQQQNINLYLPITITILLTIILSINLIYFIYSIKQLRCCLLELQWQKINQHSTTTNSSDYNGQQKSQLNKNRKYTHKNNKMQIRINDQLLNYDENNPQQQQKVNNNNGSKLLYKNHSQQQSIYSSRDDSNRKQHKPTKIAANKNNNHNDTNNNDNDDNQSISHYQEGHNNQQQGIQGQMFLISNSNSNSKRNLLTINNKQQYQQQSSTISNNKPTINRQLLQQQIKKQLKHNQINPIIKNKSSLLSNKSIMQINKTDSIYRNIKSNYFIHSQQYQSLQKQSHKKYIYIEKDKYCTLEEYSKI